MSLSHTVSHRDVPSASQLTVPTPQETLRALILGDVVEVPTSFVGAGADQPGALAFFVQHRRGRALDLYLLTLGATQGTPVVPTYPAAVWARALGLKPPSAEPNMSRLWTWLERERLVVTRRDGRLKRLTLLNPDRSGSPFPLRITATETCRLSAGYFFGNYHNRLSLPGKAVLLVAIALGGSFTLPADVPGWYGLSSDTIRRGISILRTVGLLDVSVVLDPAPLTGTGYVSRRTYRVLSPFDQHRGLPASSR